MAGDVRLFKVVDMVKRTGIDKYGELQEYYEVYFETASGIKSSVTVPVNAKKEEIEKLIEQEAEKIEYVAKLKK